MSRIWVAIILSGIGTYAMRASFLVAGPLLAQMPVASAPSLMAPPVYAVPTLNIVPQRF